MTATLTLNLTEGSLSFPCSVETAAEMKQELNLLWQNLKSIAMHQAEQSEGSAAAGKPAPQPILEYRQVGDIFLEIFCNPNIWPTPFAAKLLITVRDDRIRVTTEATLNQILEDLGLFLDS